MSAAARLMPGTLPLIRAGKSTERHAGGPLPCADRNQRDVVGGVAGDKFVQQGGRDSRGQARHHADAGSAEVGLDGRESWFRWSTAEWDKLVPRIVDVAESGANLVA